MLTSLSLKQLIHKILPCCYKNYTEDIWNVRKYADGTAICWGITPAQTYSITAQSGYAYYTSESKNFPSGLFISPPTALANRFQGTGPTSNYSLVTINISTVTATNLNYYVQCAASVVQSLSISLFAIGKWK